MCKQKIIIGAFACVLSIMNVYALESELWQLGDSLYGLHAALQGAQPIQPAPPAPVPVQPFMPPTPAPFVAPPAPPVSAMQPVQPLQPVVPVAPVQPSVVPAPPPPPPPAPFQPVTPGPKPPVSPAQPTLPPVTPGPVLRPIQPTPSAGPAGLSAEELKRQREQREQRAAAGKRQRAAGPITDRFIKPPFTTYPSSPTVPTGLAAKDFTVEKMAINAIAIKSNTLFNQISSNLFTQEDKNNRKPLAKKMLNGLLFYVKNNVVQPDQIKQITDLVVFILNIDPLLITTADVVLHDLGFSDRAVHQLMELFFEERIRFIEETLEELKKQVTEGAIEDIDEAFAYSIALSPEVVRQESMLVSEKTTQEQKQEATRFINRIKELRKRLCEVITNPGNEILFAKKPGWFAGYLNICGKQQKRKLRAYCVSAEHTYGELLKGKEYEKCLLDQEIPSIINEISDYKRKEQEGTMSPSQRLDTVQTIITSLVDINTFFMNPDVCPKCLLRAIGRPEGTPPGMRVTKEGYPVTTGVTEPFSPELSTIVNFLKGINQRENSFYITEFISDAIPKINQTFQQAIYLPWSDADIIYNLIGENRERKARGLPPLTLQDVKASGNYPRY